MKKLFALSICILITITVKAGTVFEDDTDVSYLVYEVIDGTNTCQVLYNKVVYSHGNLKIPETAGYQDPKFTWIRHTFTVVRVTDGLRSGYTSISIPKTVTDIEDVHFPNLYNLEAINVDIANPVYSSIDGVLYNKEQTILYSFPRNNAISNFEIPNSVTTIAGGAFYECSGLESVTIPNSVTTISDVLFKNCSSLTSVSIPNSVTAIGKSAFYGCIGLESITIPYSIAKIESGAFYNCSSLKEIHYGAENPIVAESDIFSDYISPTLYAYPWSVEKYRNTEPWKNFKIEKGNFKKFGHIDLEKNNLTTLVGKSINLAVIKSGNLSELTWTSSDQNVASVDNNGIVSPLAAGEVTITVSAKDLNYDNKPLAVSCKVKVYAEGTYDLSFEENDKPGQHSSSAVATVEGFSSTGIVDVEIPVYIGGLFNKWLTVRGIKSNAFNNKENLRSVTIPYTVNNIEPGAFSGCSNLETVYYNTSLVNTSVHHFYSPIFANSPNFKYLKIDESVNTIPPHIFKLSSIESVIIPDNVESLSEFCFADCPQLTEIRLGKSITSIGEGAFLFTTANNIATSLYCNSKEIKQYYNGNKTPFKNRNVVMLEFGPDVQTLSDYAFSDLDNVKDIYCASIVPPFIANMGVLSRINKSTCALHVPTSAVSLYKNTDFWKDFNIISAADFKLDKSSLLMPVGDSTILNVAKSDNFSNLTWTSSNPDVAKVDDRGAVVALNAGEATITVSAKDFDSNKILKAYCNVTTYKKNAYDLSYLFADQTATVFTMTAYDTVDVEIPDYIEDNKRRYKVTGIHANAFADNDLLRSVTIPATISDIEPGSFYGCKNLEKVNFNSILLKTDTPHASNPIFYNCPKLKTLNIGKTVKGISQYTFKNLNIRRIDFPDNVEYIDREAFAGCSQLSEIRFGKGLKSITYNAFSYAPNDLATKIYFNAKEIKEYRGLPGMPSIYGYMPFADRKIVSLEFGPDVQKLNDYAFSELEGVNDIYCYSIQPPVIANSNVMKQIDETRCTLHVFEKTLSAYKAAEFWKDFRNIKSDAIGLVFEKDYFRMIAGSTFTIKPTKSDNLTELKWSSSNPEVATVDNEGKVTALKAGITTITASAAVIDTDMPVEAVCDVEIYNEGDYSLLYSYDSEYQNKATVIGISTYDDYTLDVEIPKYTEYEGQTYEVSNINASAFAGNKNLRSITIPASVNYIEDGAFKSCINLEKVNYNATSIKTTSKHYDNPVFINCPKLTNLNLGETVRDIPSYMFMMTYIGSIDIPDGVETLQNRCFAECLQLSEIKIGKGVKSIYESAFAFDSKKDLETKIYYNAKETTYYRGNETNPLQGTPFANRNVVSIDFGPEVRSLDDYTFAELAGVKDIYCRGIIPPSIITGYVMENIDKSCCILHVPNEAIIEYRTADFWEDFYNITCDSSCLILRTNKQTLMLGESIRFNVISIGNFSELEWTSSNPSVAIVDANGNVTACSIGETIITVSATDLGSNKKASASCNVRVIEKEEYTLIYSYGTSTATVKGLNADGPVNVVIPESTEKDGSHYTVTGISASAFAGNVFLRSVTIPSTVNNIAPGAFKGCANLETVNYYPVTVNTTTGHHANPVFSNCPKFKNLNIGETVQEIPKYMFKAIDIETLSIPDNVETLLSDCFADCYKLAEIRLGRGVWSIECASFAFGSSSALSTKIYCNARDISYYRGLNGGTGRYMPFSNRTVASIEFGPDVERLADYAFTDVSGVSDIYCNSTTPPMVANGNVLKSVNKSTCTLHVPAGSLELYRNAYFWRDFYNIKGDLSGIDGVVVEDNTHMEVYNLNGLKVGDSLEGLTPGFYIVRRGTTAEKVLVRP